jgi:cellulose synthase/poly-beta-1,6-N-acetylglucosamine synthase-like glycosyltransferase
MTSADDVTLVVPVRDEQASIDALAASIAAQTAAPAAVLFVDGGSVDGTVQRIGTWLEAHPTWHLIEAGPATPGRGRNRGIEAASTNWIALADAGTVLDQHWLARLTEAARDDPAAGVVYGHLEPALGGLVERWAALAYVAAPRATGRGPVRDGSIASCLLRRDAWELVGGFPDLRAAEDGIFMRRLAEHRVRAVCAPEARVLWSLEPTWRGTFRRFRAYSRVNVLAGEQARWHHGVARQWLLAAPFLVAGARRPRLLLIPGLALAARSARSIALRREGRSLRFAVHPARLGGVGAVLLTCDLATFAGWLDALREQRGGHAVRG